MMASNSQNEVDCAAHDRTESPHSLASIRSRRQSVQLYWPSGPDATHSLRRREYKDLLIARPRSIMELEAADRGSMLY